VGCDVKTYDEESPGQASRTVNGPSRQTDACEVLNEEAFQAIVYVNETQYPGETSEPCVEMLAGAPGTRESGFYMTAPVARQLAAALIEAADVLDQA
jgi:hypothetical protein